MLSLGLRRGAGQGIGTGDEYERIRVIRYANIVAIYLGPFS